MHLRRLLGRSTTGTNSIRVAPSPLVFSTDLMQDTSPISFTWHLRVDLPLHDQADPL